ncbi:MAG: 30S ribosomal protein S14 [Sandaracinaceae bacterium]
MASTARIAANEKRKRLAAKYRAQRAELRRIRLDPTSSEAERAEAQRKLSALPRNSSATRIRNRCFLTGRSRGYYRKFGLSRIALRLEALAGNLPGVTKSSW